MSNLNAMRSEIRRIDRAAMPRLQAVAVITVLVVAAAAGAAELHMLPSFSPEDFGCILFGLG